MDPSAGGTQGVLIQLAPLVLLFVLFYFMLIRPQQRRMKEHQGMVAGLKRGDTVVLSSGIIGKVVRVEEAEIGVEVAQGVTVKVVKAMVSEVRAKGQPVTANDKG
jgi:preprotein translocase subunit YajC